METEIKDAALNALEVAVNRALQWDKASLQRIQKMEGNSFRIDCTRPEITLFLRITAGRVELDHRGDDDTRAAVIGEAKDFVAVLTADDAATALINGNVQVIGDSAALIALSEVLKGMDIDWEEPLSQIFGDVVAHQLGSHIRRGAGWLKSAGEAFRERARRVLVDENQMLVKPHQAESLFDDIDAFSARTERFNARLKQARAQLDALIDERKPQQ